jgi:DNA-binding NarL/FixJ family response regulator
VTTVASLTYIFRRNKKNLNKQKDIAGNALQQHVQMIYREQKDNMYQEILKEFTSVYPDALDKLKKTYPELTDTELSVCMLSFFSFRVKDIANILKLRENTVSKYRSSIIKKTEAKDITKIFGE